MSKPMTFERESLQKLKRYVDAALAEYADLKVYIEPGGVSVKVGEFVRSETILAKES